MTLFGQLPKLGLSRRSVAVAAALIGTVSLALGAHAALNKLDGAKVASAEQADTAKRSSRIALVIGNSHYPDASLPLAQPVNDARALTAALRHEGFDVDAIEDATHDDMTRAVARLKSKVRSDSVVMLFFGGYGIQVGRESYMIPVDAVIWKETDVRREGIAVESVLDAAKEFGASAKVVVLDASRRNPYERRFRTFSHGLAPITLPDNALLLTSTSPGTVADDSTGENSVLVTELLTHIDTPRDNQAKAAEAIFNQTRVAVSRSSNGEQVPSVSSTLLEEISFNADRPETKKAN
ncbi:caspase family protein [Bradyrhizobium erythrophlei]|uniref:Caspase domain-containing protein n=1 Tax=Bradyrhizobium erythrophlei TaxID=1437360 RepID=A0A1M7TSJ0_9BRAD|nr:caspase family protein [Bradyrhizobium erythrophlei]SHN73685.1 Caspase domain-containing protein [Bradyrhizobium erythrophlei]